MMEYDVFISCKSEDYDLAESIYEFLKKNGIRAFLASKELRKLGDSEFRKAIVGKGFEGQVQKPILMPSAMMRFL